MFETVLVANRGEIAVRIIETCQRLGVKAIAVHTNADRNALHVRMADESVLLGPDDGYTRIDRVLEAAAVSGAAAVHPGYGFLSDNADAAGAVIDAGLRWVGPAPETIAAMADKTAALDLVAAAGVPVAVANPRPVRHIEVQILGLADGRVLSLGERDCSVRRPDLALAGETPAPGLPDEVRARLSKQARKIGELLDYSGAGTVEFLYRDADDFGFRGMRTRLQVEHPITELVSGIDLVEAQLRIAAGDKPSFDPDELDIPQGHAIEVRLRAGTPGRITRWEFPVGAGIRLDTGYAAGDEVPAQYDPLMAKLSVWAPDRAGAIDRLRAALAECAIEGPTTDLDFFRRLVADSRYAAGDYNTDLAEWIDAAHS